MPTTKSPKQVYQMFMQSLLQDTDEWKTLIAEDITINAPLARLKGIEQCIEVYEAFYERVERTIINEIVEHEDLVITQISTTMETHYEKSVILDINEWYTIRNGKIENLVVYFDASILQSADRKRYDDYIQF